MLIKNDYELKTAIERFEQLLRARPDAEGWAERIALADAIEEYEDRHHDLPPPDPITAIRFRMEQVGLTNKDLIPFLGSRSKVSEVLNGKRQLSKEMIKNLHMGLGIPLASLMGIRASIPNDVRTEAEAANTSFPLEYLDGIVSRIGSTLAAAAINEWNEVCRAS